MKAFLVGAIVLLCSAAVGSAAVGTFTLTPVVTSEQAVSCGRNGGRAALVANIDANGNIAGEWASFCVQETK